MILNVWSSGGANICLAFFWLPLFLVVLFHFHSLKHCITSPVTASTWQIYLFCACRHVCCIVICLSSAVYKRRGKEYQACWELLHSAVLLCTVDWKWILQSVQWVIHFLSVSNNESELIYMRHIRYWIGIYWKLCGVSSCFSSCVQNSM